MNVHSPPQRVRRLLLAVILMATAVTALWQGRGEAAQFELGRTPFYGKVPTLNQNSRTAFWYGQLDQTKTNQLKTSAATGLRASAPAFRPGVKARARRPPGAGACPDPGGSAARYMGGGTLIGAPLRFPAREDLGHGVFARCSWPAGSGNSVGASATKTRPSAG